MFFKKRERKLFNVHPRMAEKHRELVLLLISYLILGNPQLPYLPNGYNICLSKLYCNVINSKGVRTFTRERNGL